MSLNLAHGEMHSIRHVIKIVCDFRQICGFLWIPPLASSTNKTDCHDLAEILLKVALNTITRPTLSLLTHYYLSPCDSSEGYSNSARLSVRPSVILSCLRDNLSKHGWIWIIFCMWLVIIIILDELLHGNIWSKGFGRKS